MNNYGKTVIMQLFILACIDQMCIRDRMRTARKKSVMPAALKDLDSNDDSTVDIMELPPENSPENSITSINSISSLLKEKLMVI